MGTRKILTILGLGLGLVLWLAQIGAAAMGTAFTYQGGLIDANEPADGLYDLQFRLYDSNDPCDSNQVGSDVNVPDVDVIDGHFTVALDFGSGVFDGNAVWLEVGVRPGDQDDPNVYTLLSPRQELTPVPYSLQTRGIFVDDTRNVGIGTNSPMYKLDIRNGDIALLNNDGTKGFRLQLRADGDFGEGGFPDFNIRSYRTNRNAFTIDEDTGNVGIGYANPGPAKLAIYGNVGIGTSSPGDKLDVDGHINSSQSYKLYGDTVLSGHGARSIFVGEDAGTNNTAGDDNSAVGYRALFTNTTGHRNSAMGSYALRINTGNDNSAMGYGALFSNTTGNENSAMGNYALGSNIGGHWNTAMGRGALYSNTTGNENSAMGYGANYFNQEGSKNTMIGYEAGMGTAYHNKSGNVFIGYKAGYNETGSNKIYIANSDVDPPLIYGDFTSGKVGIGTSNPGTRLHVGAPSGDNKVTTFATNDFHAVNHTGSRLLFLMGELSGDTHSSIQAQDQGGISNNNLVLQQFGGNVGIGTTSPLSKLAVGEPSHPGIHSSVFGVWDGPLGTAEGDELALASIGHAGPTNNVALGIRAYRTSSGSTWATEAIGLGMDVDQSVRIGASIWLNSYGNVGIGTPNPSSKLTVRGNILIESESTGAPVVELGEGLDYAEGFDVSTGKQEISPGAVLIIDADNPGKLAISDKAYDSKVAGIVAGAKGQGSGVRLGGNEFDYDVALAGRVYCNVDATKTGVEPGDLLTTSATPGYAMKSTDYARAQGAILGKAMESIEKGQKGQILVLVTLQ
jgi:hypothetical protein